MKLIRFGKEGQERPGIETAAGKRIDVSSFFSDYDEAFFANDGLEKLAAVLKDNEHLCPVVGAEERWGAPIARPSKIICVGLNYAQHAKESGMEIPKEPILFYKATTAVCGPFDQVIIPKGSTKLDWEVELGVVIGKKASYVSESEAMDYVAGYVVHNDISERAFQLERGGQWLKGKSADTFAPLGPYLVTKDEVPDAENLRLWLKVNGETVQDSSTSDLIFGLSRLVSEISGFMTLLPGDVISTGTPSGVGLGFNPPRFLKAGDIMEIGIEGLGVAKQEVVAYE